MSLTELPSDLPVPQDNGEADHLNGMHFPNEAFKTTSGGTQNLSQVQATVVLYIYPMTGRPDIDLPDNWDAIPGARGCTPQSCSFRDHYAELQSLNAQVYGLSAQDTDYQLEASERLHLPFPLLSDNKLKLKTLLNIPTFTVDAMELYQRITFIIQDGMIKKVFFPVFPADKNAKNVLSWLQAQS